VLPLSQLDADLSEDTPNSVWTTPNLCDDGHDCDITTSDQWLAEMVPKIMESAPWKENGVLFVVWEEDDKKKGSNQLLRRDDSRLKEPSHRGLLRSLLTTSHYPGQVGSQALGESRPCVADRGTLPTSEIREAFCTPRPRGCCISIGLLFWALGVSESPEEVNILLLTNSL
jgi:hypothetical protein